MTLKADVVVPVYANVEVTRACIEAVLTKSGDSLGTLILVDDCGPDAGMRPMLRSFRDAHENVRLIENEENRGFVSSVNRGMTLRSRDVVILNSDARPTEGWLNELLEVSRLHPRIAAVCPLSNNATLCSVPDFGRGVPVESIDLAKLELKGLPRYTEIPTGVGFCMLLRHEVLELIGAFDPAYGRGYNEENDWCQRAQNLGFFVARANHAFVFHEGEVSFAGERKELDVVNSRRLHARYPHYLEQNRHFETGPMARVAAIGARASLGRLRVCVDVTHVVAPKIHGTAHYATALVESLKALDAVELTARVSDERMRAYCGERGIATLGRDESAEFDIVHHPSQIYDRAEAERLFSHPGHLVLTWQDLIAYRAPMALKSFERVKSFRSLTWSCLQASQAVIAISESARADLLSSFELPESRVELVPQGATAPEVIDEAAVHARHSLKPGGYFLVLGSDYPHKNLQFALDAWRLLRARRGQTSTPELVFAGPPSHVHDAFFAKRPGDEGVRVLGELHPNEVGAVLHGAAALVFPSVYEGFGLPLLEAMSLEVPVVGLNISAVAEVAHHAGLLSSSWSLEAFADQLGQVLQEEHRSTLIRRGLERASNYTWEKTAKATLAVYERVARAPSLPSLRHRDASRILVA